MDSLGRYTSQHGAFFQVIDALPVVALVQFIPYEPRHHGLHPLLSYDGISGRLQARSVFVVDAIEGGRNGGFAGEEHGRFGRRHCRGWVCDSAIPRLWVRSSLQGESECEVISMQWAGSDEGAWGDLMPINRWLPWREVRYSVRYSLYYVVEYLYLTKVLYYSYYLYLPRGCMPVMMRD